LVEFFVLQSLLGLQTNKKFTIGQSDKILSTLLSYNSRLGLWTLVPRSALLIDMTIYVGNLSYQATEDDLSSVFAEYGTVKRVVLPTDRETGRMRGFAFVEMSEDAQEDAAISELDGAEWMGRQLRVNKARPREDNRSDDRSGARRNNRF
jgi:RNA-binding proteins (RRM domain)